MKISKSLSIFLAIALIIVSLPLKVMAATPVAVSFAATVSASVIAGTSATTPIQLQGSDADGTALSFAIVAQPTHGTLSGLVAATGVVSYTPTTGYTGADSFTFNVTSGGQTSSTATVTIAVTAAKTRIISSVVDSGGNPRKGFVTFILTQPVISPAGAIPVSASVSAQLNAQGQYDVSLFPSTSLHPQSLYQVWYSSTMSVRGELLGVYDIPPTTVQVTNLEPYRVTNTNLARPFSFVTVASLESHTQQVSAATLATITGENVTDALGYTPESQANKGQANGYAALDASSKIPVAQIPSLDAAKITTGVLDSARLPATSTFIAGKKTFASSGTATVTFAQAQPSTRFSIALGCTSGETFYFTGKATTGFTLHSSNSSSTATCDWTIAQLADVGQPTLSYDGNSLTDGTVLSYPLIESYPAQANAILSAQGYNFSPHNFGVSGQQTPAMTADAAAQIDSLINPEHSQNMLSGWEGTNHIGVGGVDGPTAYAALVTYYTARKAAGSKVIAFTIAPRGDFTPGSANETARQYVNTQLRANYATYADYLVDLDTVPELATQTATWFYNDVHHNKYGSALIANKFVEAVNALYPAPSPYPTPTNAITWQNVTNLTVGGGNGLTVTSVGSWGSTGASSVQTCTSNCSFTTTATETNRDRLIGLSVSDTDRGYTEILYGIFFTATGEVQLWEGGSLGTPFPYVTGDTYGLRIVTIGGARRVQYLRKGAVIYMSPTAPPASVRIDTTFYTPVLPGGTLAAPLTIGFQ